MTIYHVLRDGQTVDFFPTKALALSQTRRASPYEGA